MLNNETEQLVNAEKYERSSERNGYHASHYEHSYKTTAGDIKLKIISKRKPLDFCLKFWND
jgi:putative transposase